MGSLLGSRRRLPRSGLRRYFLPLAQKASSSSRLAHGARKGTPPSDGLDFHSARLEEGIHSTFRPSTLISYAVLPMDGTTETSVLWAASASRTTSTPPSVARVAV